jgi:hypothetical protein
MIASRPGAKARARRQGRATEWRQGAWWQARWRALCGYAGLLGWLLREGSRQGKWPLVCIVVAGYVGVVAGTAAFGCVALAARLMQSSHPARLPGLHLEVPAEPWIIWTATVGSLLLAAVCGLAVYYSTWVTRQLVRRLHVRLRRQALEAATRAGLDDAGANPPPSSSLGKAANADAFSISTAYGLLLGTLLPLITLLWTTTVLLYLNATATLTLALLSGLYLVPMMWINRRAAQVAHAQEEARKEANQALTGALRYLKEMHGAGPLDDQARAQALSNRRFQQVLGYYDEHWLGRVKVRVWNTFFGGLCFLVVIVLHSQRTGLTASGTLLAYLISLRFAWGSVGQVTRGLVSVSRFLPRMRRFDALQAHGRKHSARQPASLPEELPLQLVNPGLPESRGQALLRRGELAVLLTPLTPTRYALHQLQGLLNVEGELPTCLIGNLNRFSTVKLVGEDWKPAFTPWQEEFLRALAADWGVPVALVLEPLGRPTDANTPPRTREREYAFWASQCLRQEPQLVWLDLAGFAGLEPAFQKALLARLANSFVILVGHDVEKTLALPAAAEATILVADAGALQGIGSVAWLHCHADAVRALVRPRDPDGQDRPPEEEEEEEIGEDF